MDQAENSSVSLKENKISSPNKINDISEPHTEAIKMGINLFMVTSVNMTSTAKMTPAIGELKIADTAAAAPHPIIKVLFL